MNKQIQIRLNQYYPTDTKELFVRDNIDSLTITKWETFLSQFDIGELKGYIWIEMKDFLNTGWKYLFYRELAYRQDSLNNITNSLFTSLYSPFSWVIWSNKWIYIGLEQENDYNVYSIPKDKINEVSYEIFI